MASSRRSGLGREPPVCSQGRNAADRTLTAGQVLRQLPTPQGTLTRRPTCGCLVTECAAIVKGLLRVLGKQGGCYALDQPLPLGRAGRPPLEEDEGTEDGQVRLHRRRQLRGGHAGQP
jgi:hypothetical protein